MTFETVDGVDPGTSCASPAAAALRRVTLRVPPSLCLLIQRALAVLRHAPGGISKRSTPSSEKCLQEHSTGERARAV